MENLSGIMIHYAFPCVIRMPFLKISIYSLYQSVTDLMKSSGSPSSRTMTSIGFYGNLSALVVFEGNTRG